jgi:[ribosomal protein S18]-alanine N-acetyltransferase
MRAPQALSSRGVEPEKPESRLSKGRVSTGSLSIRPARGSDLDAIEALEERSFATDRLTRRSLRRHIRAQRRLLVAEDVAGLAGYALVFSRKGSSVARLYSIAVDRRMHGRGVGRALLGACEALAIKSGLRILRLEVRADNRRAIVLYERWGYRCFGRYEDYYTDGAPALRFEKVVDPRPRKQKSPNIDK